MSYPSPPAKKLVKDTGDQSDLLTAAMGEASQLKLVKVPITFARAIVAPPQLIEDSEPESPEPRIRITRPEELPTEYLQKLEDILNAEFEGFREETRIPGTRLTYD